MVLPALTDNHDFSHDTTTPEHGESMSRPGLNRGQVKQIHRPWLVTQIDDMAAQHGSLPSGREIAWLAG